MKVSSAVLWRRDHMRTKAMIIEKMVGGYNKRDCCSLLFFTKSHRSETGWR